jgi:hypothetical protein
MLEKNGRYRTEMDRMDWIRILLNWINRRCWAGEIGNIWHLICIGKDGQDE